MNKDQLSKKIRETVVLRFEIIAERDYLVGVKKAKFINAELDRVNDEISSMNPNELLQYLEHQSFKLGRELDHEESSDEFNLTCYESYNYYESEQKIGLF